MRTPWLRGKEWRLVRARYRLGTTSFIHPAGWLANARRLAGRVRDVELLLFEPPAPGAVPDADELAGLAQLAAEAGLTYTVHAPLSASLASEDPGRRAAGVEMVRRTIALAAPLAPHAVIVHLYLGDGERGARPADLAAWRRRAEASLGALAGAGLPLDRLCLETLDYDFALAEPVVEALGLSVAIDAGHLARDGVPLEPVLARNAARTRVVQWHGTAPGGRDHRSLRHLPRADALGTLAALRRSGFDGVLTLEVFGAAELEDSLAVLAELEAALEAEWGAPAAGPEAA